jgi:hypothetical protein
LRSACGARSVIDESGAVVVFALVDESVDGAVLDVLGAVVDVSAGAVVDGVVLLIALLLLLYCESVAAGAPGPGLLASVLLCA